MMTRKSTSINLHGLSKSDSEGFRPLPERVDDPSPYTTWPTFFVQQSLFQRGVSVDSSEDEDRLTLSYASSLGTVRTNTSYDDSVRTIGNSTTGRSSVYSWGNEDEFDKLATAKVFHLFEDIDLSLFTKNCNVEGPLKEECYDWKRSFQYLRLKGIQAVPDREQGTQQIPISENFKETMQFDETSLYENITEGINGLSICGNKVNNCMDKPDLYDSAIRHEEIFVEDGQVHEYFAYDDPKIESSVDMRDNKSNVGRAMPPVTPRSVSKDIALSECFDYIWLQLVDTLTNLLKLYVKKLSVQKGSFDFYGETSFVPSIIDPYKLTQQLNSEMKIKSDLDDLKNVMTIRSVSLNHRASNSARVDDDNQSRLDTASSSLTHKRFGKPANSSRMMSAKTHKRSLRLLPLQPPRTAGHVEFNVGEVRGTSLSNTNSERRQQSWVARNGTLPPLDRHYSTDEFREKSPKGPSRASSAANPTKNFSRERTSFSFLDSRPNTNQSYRSDLRTPNFHQLPPSRSRDLPLKHNQPQTINENSFLQISSNQEIDGLVLWGHGPPLLSHQHKRPRMLNNSNNDNSNHRM